MTRRFASVLSALLWLCCAASAQKTPASSGIESSALDLQVRGFLRTEVLAHVQDIKTLDPPPDRVVGALTSGDFSWGTFMRTLGAYSQLTGEKTIADHDVLQMISRMAQIELQQGGKTWAQLYAAMALESFGADLERNALWQSMNSEERETYRNLLDPGRFYDVKSHTLIHLPENYFGVAARIAAIDYELGINNDRPALDDLLNHAAKQFTGGALFADDAPPTGRYDRYSNEYARVLYEAAEIAGRQDILKAIASSLTEQMRLWWDVLSEDGYGYSWGRSLGAISYMDTLEIVAFLGTHRQFRPAPLPQLAAAYAAAWHSLEQDFNRETHLLRIFEFGRGDYSYITKEREWQQTTTFFGKAIGAHQKFMLALQNEGVKDFPSYPSFADVARFQYFMHGTGRKFGVWVVRQGNLHFALPFVTGPKAATSDYEPVPDGYSEVGFPVERIYPCIVPFLELENGQTIAATDGADEIRLGADGKSVIAVSRRWVVPGSKAGEFVDPGLMVEVTWTFEGTTLRRAETLAASRDVKVGRLWLTVPSRYDHLETSYNSGTRADHLFADGKALDLTLIRSDWSFDISAFATGNDPLGRGDRGPIPLHLVLQTKPFAMAAGEKKHWEMLLAIH